MYRYKSFSMSSSTSTNHSTSTAALCKSLGFVCKAVACLSSVFYLVFWSALSLIEDDIKHDVNWFLFLKNHFTKEHDFFFLLKFSHLFLIISYLVCFIVVDVIAQSGLGQIKFIVLCQIIFVILTPFVSAANVFLFYLLQTTGYKIWQISVLAYPLAAVRVASSSAYTLLLVVSAMAFIVYVGYKMFSTKQQGVNRKVFLGLSILLAVLVLSVKVWSTVACGACLTEKLPEKPGLTAHRGCPNEGYPESSVKAFERASQMDSVITLESDVRLSADGELFLLHDPFLVRTTSVMESCPEQDPYLLASSSSYYSGDCPLQLLRLKGSGTFSLKIPTIQDLLKVAKESGKNVIFDLEEPPPGHLYGKDHDYIDTTLKALIKSEIQLKKIWWLHPVNRSLVHSRYPELTLVAKTHLTDLEEFEKLGIQIANEEWSTSISTIRKLKEMGILVNMYTVDTIPLFEYAWCLGVDSVTTNNCRQFGRSSFENQLHKYCYSGLSAINSMIMVLLALFLCCLLITAVARNTFSTMFSS